MFTIYIPSKGRPDFATVRLLNEPHPPYLDSYVCMDVDMEEKPRPYTVFIEPQDAEAYRKADGSSPSRLRNRRARRRLRPKPPGGDGASVR